MKTFKHTTLPMTEARRALCVIALVGVVAGAAACGEPLVHDPSLDETGDKSDYSWWKPATGSFGDFTPKPFLEADKPWRVIQIAGPHQVGCNAVGDAPYQCTRTKKYGFFDVRSSVRTSSLNAGVGTPICFTERFESPSLKTVELKYPNNLIPARLDGTGVSSRLKFENAQTITASRTGNSLYSGAEALGHIEGEKANKWVRLSPFSYYYYDGDQTLFGLTSVEQMFVGSIFRQGTHVCRADSWQLNTGLASLLSSDTFDMDACEGDKLLTSKTTTDVAGIARALFLDRQDSDVTFIDSQDSVRSYAVKARREWQCLFDCDGTNYSIHPQGVDAPAAIEIDSDRWNFKSTTNFKIKVIRADWNRDGTFVGRGEDLRDLANNEEYYQEIVAVIVSEMKDALGDSLNAQWTQNTFVIFPPVSGALRESIFPAPYRKDADTKLLYNLKLVDAVLAMMPDQSPNSPELADAEQKIDELRLLKALQYNNGMPDKYYVDLLFDVYSEYDTTTAVSWKSPLQKSIQAGKIEWMLGLLGY